MYGGNVEFSTSCKIYQQNLILTSTTTADRDDEKEIANELGRNSAKSALH